MKNLLWGEARENSGMYMDALNLFCSVVYDYLAELYDGGVRDFHSFDNYNLFLLLFTSPRHDGAMKLLFGENAAFRKYADKNTLQLCIYDEISGVHFDRYCYEVVSGILKQTNLLTDKRQLNPAKMQKNLLKAVVEEQRFERSMAIQKANNGDAALRSDMFDVIESCLCWVGRKSKAEINSMYVWEVREGFARVQAYEWYKLVMGGYYAGTINLTGSDREKLDWARSLN